LWLNIKENRLLFYLLPAIPPLLWGASIVIAKWIGTRIFAINLVFMRFLITIPFLLPLLLILHHRHKNNVVSKQNSNIIPDSISSSQSPFSFRHSQKGMLLLLLVGITGVALNNALFYYGLSFILASDSALVVAFSPILSVIYAAIFLKDPFNRSQLIGTFVGLFGVSLIIGSFLLEFDASRIIGLIFTFMAIALWSSSFILAKLASQQGYSAIAITHHSMLLGVLMLLPVVAFIGIIDVIILIMSDIELIIAFIVLGIGPGAFAYSLWYSLIHKLGTVQTAIYVDSLPFWAIFFSAIFLQEVITIFHIVGLVIIAIGVIMVNRQPRESNRSISKKHLDQAFD